MRRVIGYLVLPLLCGSCATSRDVARPSAGFVPDAATATRIAVAVWTPIYGAAELAAQKPYQAVLRQGVWFVRGSMPENTPGGVASAKMAQKDGRILEVMHGE
jgi:hypothetical protein